MLPGFRNGCAGCFLVEYLLFGKTDDRRLLNQSHFPKAILFACSQQENSPCHGLRTWQKFPDRQRRYCYGCSAYRLSTGLNPETSSWALQEVSKKVDIPDTGLKVRSGDWRIPRGLSHGIPR